MLVADAYGYVDADQDATTDEGRPSLLGRPLDGRGPGTRALPGRRGKTSARLRAGTAEHAIARPGVTERDAITA